MKLLHILPSIDPAGGGPMEGVRLIGTELKKRGHEVEVVTLDSPADDFVRAFPHVVHALGPSVTSYRFNRKLVPWLRANAPNYDAVVVNGIWQYHSFGAWRALKGINKPYYLFTHGMLDPWFKKAYPLKHLKKWLYWPWAEYRVIRDAAAVLFTCDEEKRVAKESFWLYRCNERVTAYGTEAPVADPEGILAQRFIDKFELDGKRLLLFLGRIHEKKGCDLLIQAFSEARWLDPSLHLVMAGPDQTGWAGKLKKRARELGIESNVSWVGMMQGDDKWGAFHAADAFCLPSHQENFGIVVAEALACSKPVLISDRVNIWREIESDGAGIVRQDTPDGTLDALVTWLRMSNEDRSTMRDAASRCFNQRFRIDRVADSLVEIVATAHRAAV